MEKIKKRNSKFRCLFGGNDEFPSQRFVESNSSANPTELNFEARKVTSTQSIENRVKNLLNGISCKLVGRRRDSKEIVNRSSDKRGKNKERLVCNGTACEWRGVKETISNISSEGKEGFKSRKKKELVCNGTTCQWRGARETVSDISNEVTKGLKSGKNKELFCDETSCEWRGANENVTNISNEVNEGFKSGNSRELVCNGIACEWRSAKDIIPEISNEVKEGIRSGHVDYVSSGSFSDSEEITVSSRIIIDHHDRLTHSISHMSKSSLISEATTMSLERCYMAHINDDEGVISEVEKETKPKESGKVASLVAVRDVFASPNGLGSLMASSSMSTSVQPSFDDPNNIVNADHDEDDVDEKMNIESSNQGRRKVQKDVFNYQEDLPLKMVRSNKRFQSSQKPTEICFKNEDPAKYQPSPSVINIDAQVYGLESEDVAFASDDNENVNARLQDLKKNINQLTIESTIISSKLRLIPKVKHFGQLSAYMEHTQQTLETHDTNETTHDPTDPMIFNCLEYYYEGTALLTFENRVFYDYVEQMVIKTSKSTAVYPWVNPVKREGRLALLKPDLEDQIRNVVYEIEKDYHENFCEIYYDKDSEWVQPTNDIDILGMLIAELVLNDLLQEVVDINLLTV